jgi:hypothetical protein
MAQPPPAPLSSAVSRRVVMTEVITAVTEAAIAVAEVAGEDVAEVVAAVLEIPFSICNLYNGPDRETMSYVRDEFRFPPLYAYHPA